MTNEELNVKYEDECVKLQSNIRLEDWKFVLTKWNKPWKKISFKTEKEMVEYFIEEREEEISDIEMRIKELNDFIK